MRNNMAFFQSAEQRSRHTFIDDTVGNYLDLLAGSTQENGYIDESKKSNDKYIINRLTVPNLRHGVLQMSRKAIRNEDYIPIFPMHADESVLITPEVEYSLHPLQRTMAIEYFTRRGSDHTKTDKDLNNIIAYYNENSVESEAITSPGAKSALAFVRTKRMKAKLSKLNSGKNSDRAIQTRPYIFLEMGASKTPKTTEYPRMSPDILNHELTHVIQALIEPVLRFDTAGSIEDDALRNELEAYSDQEAALLEMHRQAYTPKKDEPRNSQVDKNGNVVSTIGLINNRRRSHNENRKDKFFPDGKLRKELAARGLQIHYSLPADIPRHTSTTRHNTLS